MTGRECAGPSPGTRDGRSLRAVFNPQQFAPFPGITTASHFRQVWKHNPMWVLANMAHAAYCSPESMQPLFRSFGADTRFYASSAEESTVLRGRQAFLSIWEDKAILSFRGTEVAETLRLKTPEALRTAVAKWGVALPEALDTFVATDILDDLNITLVPYQKSRVHQGFLKATQDLWPAIEDDLKTLASPARQPVYATGHSLGGAMAVIAGMTYPVRRIITFGEPRVGATLKRTLSDPAIHIRYVNGNDPVPWMIPSGGPFRYKHHGELRRIVDRSHGGPNALYDHSIVNYGEVLRETPRDPA
jgi:hypothetical protein